MKLYFKDLPCYQDLSDTQKKHTLYLPENAFDLSRLPETDIRNDFAAFIYDRSENLTFISLRHEQSMFHNLADFLKLSFPDLSHLTDIPIDTIERELKKYLLSSGKPLYSKRKNAGKGKLVTNPVIGYLHASYRYFLPDNPAGFDRSSDVWLFDDLPFMIRSSPIGSEKKLDFSKIKQQKIKDEIKEGIIYNLKRLSVRTVISELYAIQNLSEFLFENYPEIKSLKDFERSHLEEYLSFLFLESKRRTNYRGELSSLKNILNITGRLLSFDNLRGIFLKSDFPKHKKTIYKSYSDAELERLHKAYRLLDKQTARLLLIHELLGLRISDTLTLKKSDVVLSDESYINITQPKTGVTYKKMISPELSALLTACIGETEKRYPESPYIFTSDSDPAKPMKYSALYYRISSMINAARLTLDNGKPLTAATHIFRHTYGKKLCDLFKDDMTIASLLGHRSISSVAFYRQMSPEKLYESSKTVINARDEKIKQYKKGWME